MNNIEAKNSTKLIKSWHLITTSCIIIYIVVSIIFIYYGELNADEGWYLYASKLVYDGKLPYKDFAFTQTPLLPYVYGLIQNFGGSSLFLGRITSVLFSSIALFFSIQSAKKISGPAAGALTAVFWATFTYGIYYQSITKTYSLLLFFISSTIYYLLIEKDKYNERRLVIISVLVLLASLTRLSAVFFAIPLLLFALFKGTKTTRFIIFLLSVATLIFFGLLAFPNWESAQWNIILHHTNQWGEISNLEKAKIIMFPRLPLLFLAFPTYTTLLFAIVGFNFTAFLTFLRKNGKVSLILLSLILFAAPNLASGGFYSEYFIPLLFSFFPIVSSIIVTLWAGQSRTSRIALQVILLSTFILGFLRGGMAYIDTSGGQLPIYEVQELANIVKDQANSNEPIFAFEGLWIVVESNRRALPNMAMAQFSYFDGASHKARQFHLINDEMIIETIQKQEPAMLILTTSDWEMLESLGSFEAIEHLIFTNYTLLISKDNFGQTQENVKIYTRLSP